MAKTYPSFIEPAMFPVNELPHSLAVPQCSNSSRMSQSMALGVALANARLGNNNIYNEGTQRFALDRALPAQSEYTDSFGCDLDDLDFPPDGSQHFNFIKGEAEAGLKALIVLSLEDNFPTEPTSTLGDISNESDMFDGFESPVGVVDSVHAPFIPDLLSTMNFPGPPPQRHSMNPAKRRSVASNAGRRHKRACVKEESHTNAKSSTLNILPTKSAKSPAKSRSSTAAAAVQANEKPHATKASPKRRTTGSQRRKASTTCKDSVIFCRPKPYTPDERQKAVRRYMAKRKKRNWKRQPHYASRHRAAVERPRVNGRFVKTTK